MSALAVMFCRSRQIRIPRCPDKSPESHPIAVVPLANVSGDPGQDYLASGMTEALITDLSKISALNVVRRTSTSGNQTKAESPSKIGRELNVAGVVEGSVARSGNNVHVSLELIRTVSGTTIWAETYDRNIEELQSLQRDLARQIVRETETTVAVSEEKQLADSEAGTPGGSRPLPARAVFLESAHAGGPA